MLAVAEVDKEAEHEAKVAPENEAVDHAECGALGPQWGEEMAQHRGEWSRAGKSLGMARRALRNERRVVELHAQEQTPNPAENEDGVALVGAAEAGGVDDDAIDESHEHAGEDQDAEEVLQERDDRRQRKEVEADADDGRLEQALRDSSEEDDETPEDERVENARVGPAEQPGLGHDVHEEGLDPAAGMIGTIIGTLGSAHGPEETAPAERRHRERGAEEGEKSDGAENRGHVESPYPCWCRDYAVDVGVNDSLLRISDPSRSLPASPGRRSLPPSRHRW